MESQWNDKIFTCRFASFEALAIEIFHYQYANNITYQSFVKALTIDAAAIDTIEKIPFLPIRFFKTNLIQTGKFLPETIFESSGTTGAFNSQHAIKDLSLYETGFEKGFEKFYGAISDYVIIGLLPSYLERNNSSLVYMVNRMIVKSNFSESGFYLNEWEKLAALLQQLEQRRQKTLLIGVSFALLDFAERFSFPLQYTTIIETGGMKGRRKEIIRAELHERLQQAFSLSAIHSEYGMTELLSQAWSKGRGIFYCAPWMKLLLREEEDPLSIKTKNDQTQSGAINIIDLANVHSCSFIATDDVGKTHADGGFEVLGRLDNSDLRGCSLLTV